MANAGIEEIIADTYDALGLADRAAMVRANLEPADDAQDEIDTLWDTIETIRDLVADVPESSSRHEHTNTCHHARAQCLAAEVRDVLSDV